MPPSRTMLRYLFANGDLDCDEFRYLISRQPVRANRVPLNVGGGLSDSHSDSDSATPVVNATQPLCHMAIRLPRSTTMDAKLTTEQKKRDANPSSNDPGKRSRLEQTGELQRRLTQFHAATSSSQVAKSSSSTDSLAAKSTKKLTQRQQDEKSGLEIRISDKKKLAHFRALATNFGHICERLICSGFQVRRLPSGLDDMHALTRLSLSAIGLSDTIPSGIDKLVNLQDLDLSDNCLTQIPDFTFLNLNRLHTLLLGGNRLRTLPPDIGYAVRLVQLDISCNSIAALPPSLFFVNDGVGRRRWHSLRCNENLLSALPAEIFCSSIQQFDCSDNPFTRAENSIASKSEPPTPTQRQSVASLAEMSARCAVRHDPLALSTVPELLLVDVLKHRLCVACGQVIMQSGVESSAVKSKESCRTCCAEIVTSQEAREGIPFSFALCRSHLSAAKPLLAWCDQWKTSTGFPLQRKPVLSPRQDGARSSTKASVPTRCVF